MCEFEVVSDEERDQKEGEGEVVIYLKEAGVGLIFLEEGEGEEEVFFYYQRTAPTSEERERGCLFLRCL